MIVRVVDDHYFLLPEHQTDKFLIMLMADFGIKFKRHEDNKFLVFEMIP